MSAPISPLLDANDLMTIVDDISSPFTGVELWSEDYDTIEEVKTKKKRRRGDCKAANGSGGSGAFNIHVKNAEMKTLLRENIEDMRVLEQNLNKQLNELVQMLPRSANMMPRNLPYDTVQDDSVFKMMARHVDEQYKDMENVLRLANLDGTNSEVADAFICRSNSEAGTLLKSRTRALLPFKSSSLVTALWRNVEGDESAALRAEEFSKKLELSLDVASRIAVQKYEVVVDDHACTMRMVMKQFIEKDRIVQVWSILADWPLVGAMRDIQTHEQGWGFIQPLNENTSVCLDYSLMNPTIRGMHPSENYDAQLKFLAKLYQSMIVSRLHKLENQTSYWKRGTH